MIVGILVCLVVTGILQVLTPYWWWIMVVPFGYCLFRGKSGGRSFVIGMTASGLLWLGGSLYFWLNGGELIAQRMAVTLQVGQPWLLVALTTVIALLSGGFAALCGHFLGRVLGLSRPPLAT